jgi:hypothetical protein
MLESIRNKKEQGAVPANRSWSRRAEARRIDICPGDDRSCRAEWRFGGETGRHGLRRARNENKVKKLFFPSDRETFKQLTAQAAFEMLRRKLIT